MRSTKAAATAEFTDLLERQDDSRRKLLQWVSGYDVVLTRGVAVTVGLALSASGPVPVGTPIVLEATVRSVVGAVSMSSATPTQSLALMHFKYSASECVCMETSG